MAARLFPLAMQLVRRNLVRRGARSSFVEAAGRQVDFYEVEGKGRGPEIVLVHGLGGTASGWSRCLLPLSRLARRVLAVDMPGAGFSPEPTGGPLRLAQLMDVLVHFIDRQTHGPVGLVGNSLGGAMSVRYASLHPRKVRALVLVAPAGARVQSDDLRKLLRQFRPQDAAQARALMKRLFHKAPILMPLVFGHELVDLFQRPSIQRLVSEAEQIPSLERHELAGLQMPVLLLWGKSERLLPYDGIHFFREHLPRHARVEEVEGFGHCPQLERPRELVERIESFLHVSLAPGGMPHRAAERSD